MHMSVLIVYFPSHNRDTTEKAFFLFSFSCQHNNNCKYRRNGVIEPLGNGNFKIVVNGAGILDHDASHRVTRIIRQ